MTRNTTSGPTTGATIREYFDRLSAGKDWAPLFADDMIFTSRTSPERQIAGRDAYVQGTKGFFSAIASVEVRDLLIDEDKACALTRYQLRRPNGAELTSDVAEVFAVRGGKIDALTIYFDSAAFPK